MKLVIARYGPSIGFGIRSPGEGPADPRRRRSLIAGVAALCVLGAVGGEAKAQQANPVAQVQGRSSLRVVVPASWKPQFDLDENGRPVGFAIDVMNAVAARAGVTVTYRVARSFPDAVDILDRGEADLIPNSRIRSDRLERYAFSFPVETYAISIFVRNGNRDIAGESDLDGRKLGVVKSHIGVRLFRNKRNLSLVTLPDVRAGISQLIDGEIDALVYSEPALVNAARLLGVDEDIVAAGEPLVTIRRGIRVLRQDAALLERLNPAVKAFVATPEYRRIYQRWFLGPRQYWTPTRIAWAMGFALALSVVGMAGWCYATVSRLNRDLRSIIAEREAAEREAGEKAAMFESAIANLDQGFNIYDADLRLVAFNDEYVRIMKFPPGFPRIGIPLEEIVRFRVERGDYGRFESADAMVQQQKARIIDDVETTREQTQPDGTTLMFYRKPLPDGGIVTIVTDITSARKAERGLRESEELLRQAQKMEAVGQLTGGVAHDFNNLLTVILGNAELLSDRIDRDLDKLMQPILRAAERGAQLTQRLLAFSRRQALRPRTIDVGALVAEMNGLLRRALGETIEMRTVVETGLWPALADAGQVENALLNLAINARDAMPGGGALTIECANVQLDETYVAGNPEAEVGAYVLLAVSDTGCGMAPEVASRVFEPFFTTKAVGQGSGLGLSMVYGFAKQSGGHVSVYSEVGVGTTVKLYLPRAPLLAVDEAAGDEAEVPLGNGETILVIEDDPEVRGLARAMLEELGYKVSDAVDAANARNYLARHGVPDLILSDVVLPGGTSGPQFADEARASYPRLKIIFMSGYPAEAARRNGFPGSGNRLLNKPFQSSELARAVRDALG